MDGETKGTRKETKFPIAKAYLCLAPVLMATLDMDEKATLIPVLNIPTKALRYATAYLTMLQGTAPPPIPCPVMSNDPAVFLPHSPINQQFIAFLASERKMQTRGSSRDIDLEFKLFAFANWCGFDALYQLMAAYLATECKGRTGAQIAEALTPK